MPIYEYTCQSCGRDFELLVRGSEKPACPHCSGERLTKLMSVVAGHVAKGGDSGPPPGGCGRPQCGTGGCAGLG